jgi:hypothetical protein
MQMQQPMRFQLRCESPPRFGREWKLLNGKPNILRITLEKRNSYFTARWQDRKRGRRRSLDGIRTGGQGCRIVVHPSRSNNDNYQKFFLSDLCSFFILLFQIQ